MTTDTMKQTRFTVRELPYAYDALAPHLSEETLRYHHDKHYAGYVAKVNELVLDTPFADMPLEDIVRGADGALFNNAAQAWNHEFYFAQLSPAPQREPDGLLREAIEDTFGSCERLKEKMCSAGTGLFGSGWAWLVEDKTGSLAVVCKSNADNPICEGMNPLLTLDVWEHAYYIDYRNRRADALEALWKCIDWEVVCERYGR